MNNEQEKEICSEIRTISNLIKRKLEADLSKNEENITLLKGKIISYLYYQKGDIFQKDLEKLFVFRGSTATEILKSMEKSGLILKSSVSYDARLKKITLTKKAQDLHHQFIQDYQIFEKNLKKNISKKELELFFSILAKIKNNIL